MYIFQITCMLSYCICDVANKLVISLRLRNVSCNCSPTRDKFLFWIWMYLASIHYLYKLYRMRRQLFGIVFNMQRKCNKVHFLRLDTPSPYRFVLEINMEEIKDHGKWSYYNGQFRVLTPWYISVFISTKRWLT